MPGPFRGWHYDKAGSTNDIARGMAAAGAPHATVIHADEQTAGRGRRSHTWFSPLGNLYLSVLLRTGQPLHRNIELSFLTALVVADTVEQLLPSMNKALLKWPNDVLVQGSKIAGVLLEQADDSTIIGIGLNISQAPTNTAYKTTTIVANGGTASVIAAREILLHYLDLHLAIWRKAGFPPIREQWLSRSYSIGAALQVHQQGQTISGAFGGLDSGGALLLDTAVGRQRIFAGDIAQVEV